MAKNGATAEEIQTAQADLLRGLGSGAPQPATGLLKSGSVLVPAIAGAVSLPAVGVASVIVGGAIGGGSNVLFQITTNGEKPINYRDVATATAVGAATQGKGLIPVIAINIGSVYTGNLFKNEDPSNPIIATGTGSLIGENVGSLVSKAVHGIAKPPVAEVFGAIGGALATEGVTAEIQQQLDNSRGQK
ncbi:hypothetical protein ACPWR0_18930 [Pandoraea pneumonica]|uniref:hypothetical protein n=1 Tax=Pandoraea pneumonica TaxID=2508299 RepID=UPI003CF77DA9